MFENTDDEESFFAPVKSTNLASLFGMSMSTESSTSSLTYTPPKQPQKSSDESTKATKSKLQSSIIVFKEVHAFKMADKNYLNQGRVGLALIGNEENKTYQLLLYRQKTDIISCSKVNGNFLFLLKKENHATFTDDQKVKWTIRFNNEPDLNEFEKALEARGGRVTSLSTKPEAPMIKPDVGPPKKIIDALDIDKEAGDTDGSMMKASILSRMAKMGQKVVLPQTPTSITEGSDSDSDARTLAKHKKNRRVITNEQQPVRNIPIVQPSQFMLVNGQYIPVLPQQSVVVPVSNSLTVPTEPPLAAAVPTMLTDQLNVFFAENRTHNSEVRMNVVRLTNKMEEMLDKLNKLGVDKISTDAEGERDERRRLEATVAELEKKCRELSDRNRDAMSEYEREIDRLRGEKSECEKKAEELEAEVQNLQAKLTEMNSRFTDRSEDVEEVLKKIMNAFYYELGTEFKDESVFYGADVKKVLAPKIVEKTYKLSSKVADLIKSKTCS